MQNFPWHELIKLWQKLDSSGVDSTWVADHFVNYANPTESWFESWTDHCKLYNLGHQSVVRPDNGTGLTL
jgi:hypothetical protein